MDEFQILELGRQAQKRLDAWYAYRDTNLKKCEEWINNSSVDNELKVLLLSLMHEETGTDSQVELLRQFFEK